MPRLSQYYRSIWLGLMIAGLGPVAGTSARAQDVSSEPNSLARYAPKDNLLFYLEYQGLDAHAEAWKKTAAYKILNETTTGAMLEDLAAQLIAKIPMPPPQPSRTGPESVAMIKHLAHHGFLWAVVANPQEPSKPSQILVVRNAFKDKTIRGLLARDFQNMNAPNTKPVQAVKLGHKIVTGVQAGGQKFAWWVEDSKKDDIVLVVPTAEAPDVFLETLDGKRPNATQLDRRIELLKSENGFVPNGVLFLDNHFFEGSEKIRFIKFFKGLTSLDVRWGFQNDAIMTITKVGSTAPRTGLLAMLDGPGFDRTKLPPMPDDVGEFTVASLDIKQVTEQAMTLAKNLKPDLEKQITSFLDAIKASTKLRLQEDILAHVGPKVVFYALPAKPGAKATAGPSGMLGTIISSLGASQVPRAALVFEIDNPAAFGKVLDQVMVGVNKELKTRAAKELGGEAASSKSGRARSANVSAPEFRSMPGETKSYVMSVPPSLSSQYPASFRPSIRVGAKYAVLAVTAEVAKAVLDTKDSWTPTTELTPIMQGLPMSLKILNVSDPRDTFPAILASLPGTLQKTINSGIQLAMSQSAMGAASPAAPPSQPGVPGAGGANLPNKFKSMTPNGAAPSVPGAGGNPAPTAPAGSIILQVDSSKLPSAGAIKGFLFPSVFAIESNDREIRIITRSAFPTFPDFSKLLGLAQLGSAKGAPAPGESSSGFAPNSRPGIQTDPGNSRGGGLGARDN